METIIHLCIVLYNRKKRVVVDLPDNILQKFKKKKN